MPAQPTRVAILHYAAPPVVGGVESTIYHHARLLVQSGYPVDVIAGRGEQFLPQVVFHRIEEIDSRHPKVLSVGRTLAEGWVTPEFVQLRDRLAARLRPLFAQADVVIVHNALTLHKNLALTAALRLLSDEGLAPLVAWSHDFAWQDQLYTPDLHPGHPWDLLRQPWPGVRYVVVSEHRQEKLSDLLHLPPEDLLVITPGVDLDEFLDLKPLTRRLVEELDLLSAEPLMLLPARITRRKNIQFALRVTAALRRSLPQAQLVVTGPPGPHNPKNQAYLESLQALQVELGLDAAVHFLYRHGSQGQPLLVPDEIVADFFRLSDLLLFPSLREGFGIPVLEAGLTRLPVFAADIPPVLESAGAWATRFDPRSDPEGVAQQIDIFLAQDRAYQLRRRVYARFTWQAILKQQLIPLIEELQVKENGDHT